MRPPTDDISLVQTRVVTVVVVFAALCGVGVAYLLGTWRPAAPAPTRVAVIGDSYTEGTPVGGATSGTNWTSQVVPLLHQQGIDVTVAVKGAGGSGYVATGGYGVTFRQLVPSVVTPDTDLLVVFGSRNDSEHPDVQREAAATFTAARLISPDIKILAIGPEWIDGNVPGSVADTRDEVRAAAAAARVDFVDPLAEGWFAGPDHQLIGSDGWHPTDAGHRYMAEKIAPRMAELLRRPQ